LILYFKNGRKAIEKKYTLINHELEIQVSSWYTSGGRFESYNLYALASDYLTQLEEHGIEFIVNSTPHLAISTSNEGVLSGHYRRWYNTGKEWMFLVWDEGKLLEVIVQHTPEGVPIDQKFDEGNGSLIHFHHYQDTAAVLSYKNGLKHGPFKLYYKRNNSYISGTYDHGLLSGGLIKRSFSGFLKEGFLYNQGNLESYAIYGPKNKLYRKYTVLDGKPHGLAIEYDFYLDTAAVFNFNGGLLHGAFERFINGNSTRKGKYDSGEQTGQWLTSGLFNEVAHITYFNTKNVSSNLPIVPQFNFTYKPMVDIPQMLPRNKTEATSLDENISLFDSLVLTKELTIPFDHDTVWGSSIHRLNISEMGFLNSQDILKTPSAELSTVSEQYVFNHFLSRPKLVHGFPSKSAMYSQFDYYRE